MTEILPQWALPWLATITLGLQIVLIFVGAGVLRMLVKHLIRRIGERYSLPAEMVIGARRGSTFLIYSGALLPILDRLRISARLEGDCAKVRSALSAIDVSVGIGWRDAVTPSSRGPFPTEAV